MGSSIRLLSPEKTSKLPNEMDVGLFFSALTTISPCHDSIIFTTVDNRIVVIFLLVMVHRMWIKKPRKESRMSLIRFSPLNHEIRRGTRDGFHNLWDEVNHLFDAFSDTSVPTTWQGNSFVPALDVKEDDKTIFVHAELPGLEEKDIDVSIKDGVLTLKGEKKAEEKKEGRNHVRIERAYGSFFRSIALSSEVDESKVDAVFKNGILSITLPKSTTAKTEQKIKIKSA